jgi:hypothetical protein
MSEPEHFDVLVLGSAFEAPVPLNERGIVTARGGQCSASTVIDVLARLA